MASNTSKPGITFDLLRVFVEVASLGSIAAAARSLDLSPSLATRRLASLESALGARLFQRTTRSVKLTEAGAMSLTWARESLESYGALSDKLATIERLPTGVIRFAANEFFAIDLLPGFLQEFTLQYPQIRLSITTTDDVVKLVQEGYDVALHAGQIPESSHIGICVRRMQRILCASPQYLERRGTPARLEDLAKHNCLVHEPTEPREWVFRQGKKLFVQPIEPYLSVNNHIVLIHLALAGLGIIRISGNTVRSHLSSGALVQLLKRQQCVSPNGELPGLWILYPSRKLLYRTRIFLDALSRYLDQRVGAP